MLIFYKKIKRVYKMYFKYKDFINRYISLSSTQWEQFSSYLDLKKYKKGQTIHYMGDVCQNLSFVNSGLARAYLIAEDGKDYTWSIFFNDKNSKIPNLFAIDYSSFLTQTPSNLTIEALEDIELITISYQKIQELYSSFKGFEKLGRLLSQEAYIYLHQIIVDRQLKSAKERFKEFMQSTPYLLEKVPQYHIATFLGVTPQHLSRLKKSINICE